MVRDFAIVAVLLVAGCGTTGEVPGVATTWQKTVYCAGGGRINPQCDPAALSENARIVAVMGAGGILHIPTN